ncbi:hypothetical protein [Leisingera sp. M523]|uniref:hypothetical protein n=1 Tax=Leisingera sp. M523 TaxID=2867013 RepID=UPI0021A409DD|nr:hypothetical protein [Leisingera sp. M523]UWQ27244.1 hypothetical protein K3557_10385 [Leisingera sp. M523]
MARLRQDQIRTKVQTYFKAQLDQYLDWLDRRGLSKNALADAREEMLDHDCMVELEGLNPQYLPIARFKRKMGISDEDWQDSLPRITIELRKGRRDMLRDVLDAAESFENYSFRDAPSGSLAPPAPALPASTPLGTAIEDFISEHSRQWAPKTVMQNRAYLNILLEYFGPERFLATITKQDASDVKKTLQALPASRNTKPSLKKLPLMEVIKVDGHKKISPRTINSHIQMFAAFFHWAVTHGHAPHRLFEGMKLGNRAKKNEVQRKPFTPAPAIRAGEPLSSVRMALSPLALHRAPLKPPRGPPRGRTRATSTHGR